MNPLKRLDDRFLPELARRLDEVVQKLPSPPEPAGPAPLVVRLRRVDDRWTRRGPLALLREVPQLGAVLLGALLMVGLVTAKVRMKPERPPATAAEETPGPDDEVIPGEAGGHVGPEIGDKVAIYVAEAKARLLRQAAGAPDGEVAAVISFESYRTPEQLREIVGHLVIRRVLFRAPLRLPAGEIHTVRVRRKAIVETRKEMRHAAAVRAAQAGELLRVAATIENDPVQKEDQERDAAVFQREAKILQGECTCVFAVVVRAKLRLLAELLAVPGIRVIDAGERDVPIDTYEFSAVMPDEKITVTGGNQA
jgi:hypothetical protein